MTGRRKWTATQMDRPPHRRFRTTDHGHLKMDGHGRRTETDRSPNERIRTTDHENIKMRTEVDGWTDGRNSVRGYLTWTIYHMK